MAKYITKEDYFNARGIDLTIEFANVATDNPSGVVDIILTEVEDFVLDYIKANFDIYDEKGQEIVYDKEIMKKVMIHQVDFFRRNGNLTIDSDYTGQPLAPNAYRKLFMNGYANPQTAGSKGYREVV